MSTRYVLKIAVEGHADEGGVGTDEEIDKERVQAADR